MGEGNKNKRTQENSKEFYRLGQKYVAETKGTDKEVQAMSDDDIEARLQADAEKSVAGVTSGTERGVIRSTQTAQKKALLEGVKMMGANSLYSLLGRKTAKQGPLDAAARNMMAQTRMQGSLLAKSKV